MSVPLENKLGLIVKNTPVANVFNGPRPATSAIASSLSCVAIEVCVCLSLINCSSDIKKESFPLSNACDPSAGLCATSASVASGWMCVFITRCQARGMRGKREKGARSRSCRFSSDVYMDGALWMCCSLTSCLTFCVLLKSIVTPLQKR